MECLTDKCWLVVYTKPRSEKKLAARLKSISIDVYCPLQKTLRQWSDRKKLVELPIFPSYLFVRVNLSERMIVLQESLVVRFVYWLGAPAVIKDPDMVAIKNFISGSDRIRFEHDHIAEGAIVHISDGPFKGQQAIVTRTQGSKIHLKVPQLGCRLIADRYIERLEK